MRDVIRGFGLAAAGLIGAAILATGASAESRLFSVRTTKPGVTIVQATLDRQDLRVAGQTGSATFFRIDSPSGPVPCFNRLHFVASDGSSVDAQVDLCANNWTLTVATGAQTSAQPPAPQQVSAQGQPIAIATDDQDVTIVGVFISAKPVTITARRDPYVQVFLPRSASGTQCSQDLGLALSDGRRIARLVDACRSNSVVIVSLAGSGYAPSPPVFAPQPTGPVRPQPLPPAPAPLPPPAPMQPVVSQWIFSAPGGTATLASAAPGGGIGAFRAVCVARTGSATVTLGVSSADVRPGRPVSVSLVAGRFGATYSGIGTPRDESDGFSHPVVSLPLSDPLWAAMITERSLAVGVGRAPPVAIPLAGSSPQVKQFLAACMRGGAPDFSGARPPDNGIPYVPPAPGIGQAPMPPPPGGTIDYACDDGSDLTASFAGNTVTVTQDGAPPMTLYQAPSREGSRYVNQDAQLIGDGEDIYWRFGGGETLTCSPQ